MDVKELKERIEGNTVPKTMIFIDSCHTLMKEYLIAMSKVLNRRIVHTYTAEETKAMNGRFDRNDLLVVAHGLKDPSKYRGLEVYLVFVYLEDIDEGLIPKVVFPSLNRNQCILYIETRLKNLGLSLSRKNIVKLCEYFENDIDQIMGELYKLECLDVKALDRPFAALFECSPLKQEKLKSLPWYSGGAVDTATVLYATYMKKLKAAGEMNVSVEKQRWYAQLIREAIFVEVNILAGTFGDYAVEYFKLIEKMSPDEVGIQWNPPVAREDIGGEWEV